MPARFAPPAPAAQPMAAMNITPLIDVLLVLLVMLILTIPSITHKVPLDLPAPAPFDGPPSPAHRLLLEASGQVRLDGATLPPAGVRARLAAIAADPRRAELRIQAEPAAPYGAFDALVADVRRAGITHIGMVGNERFLHAF